jgi:hypothetical protein
MSSVVYHHEHPIHAIIMDIDMIIGLYDRGEWYDKRKRHTTDLSSDAENMMGSVGCQAICVTPHVSACSP